MKTLLRLLFGSLLNAALLLAFSVPVQLFLALFHEGDPSLMNLRWKELVEIYNWNFGWAWRPLLIAGVLLQLLHHFVLPPGSWRALIPSTLLGVLVGYVAVGMGTQEWSPTNSIQLAYFQIGALSGLTQGLALLLCSRLSPATRS